MINFLNIFAQDINTLPVVHMSRKTLKYLVYWESSKCIESLIAENLNIHHVSSTNFAVGFVPFHNIFSLSHFKHIHVAFLPTYY